MELYINNNVSDITYLSELTQHLFVNSHVIIQISAGSNSHL